MMAATSRGVTVARDNPLCGDSIELTVRAEADRITETTDRARACSLVKASARILADLVPGMSPGDARDLAARLDKAVHREGELPVGFDRIADVLLMPSRRECVLLPWRALNEALA
jgi:nitrogen fixation NifU-like protein